MRRKLILVLLLTLLLSLTLSGAVLAQEGGEPLDGTIVAVDPEAGTITLADGTVISLGGSFGHPIVDLLDAYFGDEGLDLEALAETAAPLQLDEGTAIGVEEDPSGLLCADFWCACLTELCTDGVEGTDFVGVTQTEAEEIEEALGLLTVSLDVVTEGDTTRLASVGDDIAAYHDSGIGFGVLVKLYAIVEECEESGECDLDVDFLVGEFESMGMGQLFQLYGKPSLLGVGHVRQALREQGLWSPGDGGLGHGNGGNGGTAESGEDGDGGLQGICNARAHGGNANARGHGEVVCPEP